MTDELSRIIDVTALAMIRTTLIPEQSRLVGRGAVEAGDENFAHYSGGIIRKLCSVINGAHTVPGFTEFVEGILDEGDARTFDAIVSEMGSDA